MIEPPPGIRPTELSLVLTFGITVAYPSGCGSQPFWGRSKDVKIAPGEGPREGRGGPLIVAVEDDKTLFEIGERGEIVS